MYTYAYIFIHICKYMCVYTYMYIRIERRLQGLFTTAYLCVRVWECVGEWVYI